METSKTIFLYKSPIFTKTQLNRLSEICLVIGEIFFALAVITPLLTLVDYDKTSVVASGLVESTLFWILSLFLVRKL